MSALKVRLNPGEVYFGHGDVCIDTLLGSCVAISMWHPGRKIGGLCHFMLPTRIRKVDGAELDGRYGDEAFEILRRYATKYGTRLLDYEVRLYGGSYNDAWSGPPRQVGEDNCEYARALLARHSVKPLSQELGGPGYWLLSFDLATGKMKVSHRDPAAEHVLSAAGHGKSRGPR
jgi:chemotaxis protein CheD